MPSAPARSALWLRILLSACVALAIVAPAPAEVAGYIDRIEADELPDTDLEAARNALRKGMKSKADSARLRMALAVVEMRLENGSKARSLARKAVKMDPSSAELHFTRGEICFRTIGSAMMINMKAIASAGRKSFEKAIELDPNHLDAHIGLAMYYVYAPGIAGGDLDKGEAIGRRMLQIDGGTIDGRVTLATVRARRDDWPGAQRELDSAFTEAGDDHEKRRRVFTDALRLSYFLQEDPALAASMIDERYADIAGPEGDIADWMAGRVLADLGRHDEAIVRFRAILDEDPDSGSTKYYLAESLRASGQTSEARRWYALFVEENPKDDLAKSAKKALKQLG